MTVKPTRFGPFYLDTRLAVGGTAEVYLARPIDARSDLPPQLVVKRLLPHFAGDREGRTMFEREARLHAAVAHPNVVTVYHAGESDDGEPFLAIEFIDGVDGYRLVRHVRQTGVPLPLNVTLYIAREVLKALACVHAAHDPLGSELGIVHRDVTPSNIYISTEGVVKLGDFGIARSVTRMTLRSDAGQVLKGKFAYLAPEQVAGEDADHRADLFSLATVLAEMILGKPLFPGGGQLSVLLAIRDCRVDALEEVQRSLPAGCFEVIKKGLARDPNERWANATEFGNALLPYIGDEADAQHELAQRVKRVQASLSNDTLAAVRQSVQAMRAASPIGEQRSNLPAPVDRDKRKERLYDEFENDEDQKTGQYTLVPSFVETAEGGKLGPLTFAELMESLATGSVARGDRINYMGKGFVPVESIPEFTRFLAPATATHQQITGPGLPEFQAQITAPNMLTVLVRLLENRETGVLFAEREAAHAVKAARKELYFVNGRLHHVASNSANELLGEYLVRRAKIAREELDMALAVLPRYNGRIGDTLIGLGLVTAVDIFRAIRDQGRDRVADLFAWNNGRVSFYRDGAAPHVDFPLDLDLPTLMLAGLEAVKPTETPVEEYRSRLDNVIGPEKFKSALSDVSWPPSIQKVLSFTRQPRALRDVLKASARDGELSAGEVLRCIEVLVAARILVWS